MNPRYRPPVLGTWFLAHFLPRRVRDAVLGDLQEDFADWIDEHGVVWARVLYWRSALGSWASSWMALRQRTTPRRPMAPMRGILSAFYMAPRNVLRSGRAHSILIIGTMGIAVGAITVVFTIVDGVLLRPLPFPDADQLVQVWRTDASYQESATAQLRASAEKRPVSFPSFNEWAEGLTLIRSVGAYTRDVSVATLPEQPERFGSARTTSGVFTSLGVPALIGRILIPDDDVIGAPALVVLSYGFWQRQFGGSQDVLGQTLLVNGDPHSVIGVMPSGFAFDQEATHYWRTFPDDDKQTGRGVSFLKVIGRLADGAMLSRADEELARLNAGLPETEGDAPGTRVISYLDEVVGDVRSTLVLLMAAATLVVLVSCANIAHILLLRAANRRREIAMRRALGADLTHLTAMLLGETMLLAVCGAAAAVIVAQVVLGPVLALLPVDLPRQDNIALDTRILVFSLAVATGCAVVVAIFPALASANDDLEATLRDTGRSVTLGRRGGFVHSTLTASEIALAFLLLSWTGVFGQSLFRVLAVDPGFDPAGLMTASLFAPPGPFDASTTQTFTRIAAEVSALPGVMSVEFATGVPFQGGVSTNVFVVEGAPPTDVWPQAEVAVVGMSFAETLGIPVLSGRFFTEEDRSFARERLVVNESLARRYFPGEDPVGKRIQYNGSQTPWRTIVGVVADVREHRLQDAPAPKFFSLLVEPRMRQAPLLIRTAGATDAIGPALRGIVARIAPGFPAPEFSTMDSAIRQTTAAPRFRAMLIGSLGIIAGVLALLGVYSLVGLSAASRGAEFEIRLMLGARHRQIARKVLGSGLKPTVFGLLIGIAMSLAAARAVESFVWGVESSDPMMLLAIAVTLLVLVFLASLAPMRGATRLDPVRLVRDE